MELREAYKKMIASFNGGWPAMAAALGMSQSALENRVYERKGQTVTVHQAEQMQLTSGTSFFAEAVSRRIGGVYIQLPEIPDIGMDELFDLFLQLNVRLGELSCEYQKATTDDKVDDKEWSKLVVISDEMHRAISMIMAITERVFRA